MVPREIHRALVTGGTGYIGSILADYLVHGAGLAGVQAPGSRDLDVTDRRAVKACLAEGKPDTVFHCAARAETDWCEDNFEEALRVNVEGSLNVVEEALAAGAAIVYFSSACLYPDNSHYYLETEPLTALCRYTETKLEAERRLRQYEDRILTIRMRQPFSNCQHPRNLLQKLAAYREFIDEPNSMSHLEECMPVIWGLCRTGKTGPFNLTNEGWTTPLRIAGMIKAYWKPDMEIRQITYEALLAKVRAPRVNALVDCRKLKALGHELRPVEDAVRDCLANPCKIGEYHWSRDIS